MKKHVIIIGMFPIVFSSCFRETNILNTGLEGKKMPSFSILLLNNTFLNTSNIPTGRPVIIFYFSPYCIHCRAEVEKVIQDIKSLEYVRFYFISNFKMSDIKLFNKRYGLDNYSNITIGQDYTEYFLKYFNTTRVPYMAVYGNEKELIHVVVGDVEIYKMKEILNNSGS